VFDYHAAGWVQHVEVPRRESGAADGSGVLAPGPLSGGLLYFGHTRDVAPR